MKYENCDILSNSKKVVDTTVTLSISVTPCAGMYAAVRLVPTAMLLVCREQAPTRCPVKYTSTYTLDMRHFVGVVHIMRRSHQCWSPSGPDGRARAVMRLNRPVVTLTRHMTYAMRLLANESHL